MNAKSDGNLKPAKGGQFLIERVGERGFFSPDDFDASELQLGQLAHDFAQNEVLPKADVIDAKDYDTLLGLFRQAGELGFLMAAISEEYGGLGLPKRTVSLINEKVSVNGSFSVTMAAHTGIGTLPIVYFGTRDQKKRYLPKLATGELIAAYALSEPGSGSDALGASTIAKLNAAGTHYVVNGTKQWITNGAFADVFTVFVQIEDADGKRHFSCLIVDRETPGFSHGKEEHKLGIRGSSTTPLILEDALVPAGNLLGEIGRGHEIAFNILNYGRAALGVGAVGGMKNLLAAAIGYASERKQFKTPVIEFGALRQKVAFVAAEIWASESMGYRAFGLIDELTEALGLPVDAPGKDKMKPIREYAIESSICKVYGSEAINRVASECLQMFGGYGYVEEYPVERGFRDARINMIFEGTNEINRMLIPGMILKAALSGKLKLMPWVAGLAEGPAARGEGPLGAEIDAAERFKATAGLLLQAAAMKYMQKIDTQQEVLLLLADLVMDAYLADSVVGRAQQRLADGKGDATVTAAVTRLAIGYAADRVRANANRLACALVDPADPADPALGDARTKLRDQLAAWEFRPENNPIADQNVVADYVVNAGKYSI